MSKTSRFPGTPTLRAASAGVKSDVPVLFESHPGQGKSAKITAMGEKSGYDVRCVVGSVREATDFLGLPVEVGTGNEVRVKNVPPDFAVELNAAKKGLLFLDELNTAMESTQKAMLRLLQERYAGDYKLGDHVRLIAAQNPPESATGGNDLAPAIANRVMHLSWAFETDEWLRGLMGGFETLDQPGIDDLAPDATESSRIRAAMMVAGFIKSSPHEVRPEPPTDPTLAGGAWASPRSWHNVARVLAHVDPADEETMWLVVQGLVGEAAAKLFFTWLATSDLHDPEAVLADPSIVNWSAERPDRVFALLSAIEAIALGRGDKSTWEAAIDVMTVCAESGRPDVALPATGALLNKFPKGARLTQRTREAFADLLSQTRFGYATSKDADNGASGSTQKAVTAA